MPRSIARDRQVNRAELEAFIRPRHRGLLITHRRGGGIQTSPVTIGLDSQDRIVVASYPDRAKSRNLRRNSQASVCVLSDEWNGEWVQVDGTAELIDLPEAVEPLVDYFRVISGEHSDWDEYRQAMVDQGKVLIRITIERWGPISRGGFPARLADG